MRAGKTLFCFLLAAVLLPATAAAAPDIAAKSYILLDAETGTVLAEQNADEPLPPASLTKIMTAHLIFESLKNGDITMDAAVPISRQAWAANVIGSKMFLEVGTQVSVRDLLYGIIIQSGNDACIAMAEFLYGDEAAFADEMNETAEKMKLTNTYFRNATGLPAAGQQMSARDAAQLARQTIIGFPQWYPIYAGTEFTYNGIRQTNRNRLLGQFRGADGIKTGYTEAAGFSLVSSAVRDGQRLIAVVMKTDSRRARTDESAKLLTYGFAKFKNVRVFSADDSWQLRLWKGQRDYVRVVPDADGVWTVDKKAEVTSEVHFAFEEFLTAPVAAGETVGTIDIFVDGERTHSVNLLTAEAVGEGGFFKWLLDTIKTEYLGHADDGNLLS